MKYLDLLNELSNIQNLLDASVCDKYIESVRDKYIEDARNALQCLRQKLEEPDIEIKEN